LSRWAKLVSQDLGRRRFAHALPKQRHPKAGRQSAADLGTGRKLRDFSLIFSIFIIPLCTQTFSSKNSLKDKIQIQLPSKCSKEEDQKRNRLCSDNEAGGRDGKAEIKLKELKHEEGHTALGK
jgi:hypothetical protein